MADALWYLAPFLVVAGTALLLLAGETAAELRRARVRVGVGLLLAAVLLTAVGTALDTRPSSPPPPVGTTKPLPGA